MNSPHIRRFDFFVNFLQRLIELLFFFNPGILWISKLIRDERENCCDDMALRHSGNKSVYIQALLSFREVPARKRISISVYREKQFAATFQKNRLPFQCYAGHH